MKFHLTLEEAEDILQESYLSCLKNEIMNEAWLMSCIRNQILVNYNSNKMISSENLENSLTHERGAHTIKVIRPAMEQEEHMLRKITVKSALQKITKEKRQIVEMRMKGEKFKDICDKLGIEMHVALSRSYHGMKELRELVKK
jgi:RNA polymerase sigma factor (sigma-70 family)